MQVADEYGMARCRLQYEGCRMQVAGCSVRVVV